MLLHKTVNDDDDFIRATIGRTKIKFDKYWWKYNLLMFVADILDPRCKMKVVEFCLMNMYTNAEARENIIKVREALYEIYEEYACKHQHGSEHSGETRMIHSDDIGRND